MTVLLTGVAGYIGSHVAVSLVAAGHDVVCFDNLSNSRADVIERIEAISGKSIPLVVGDIRDSEALRKTLVDHDVSAVIHFAGLNAVGESVAVRSNIMTIMSAAPCRWSRRWPLPMSGCARFSRGAKMARFAVVNATMPRWP